MLKFTHRWANALLKYAEENGLSEIYHMALMFVLNKTEIEETPELFRKFISVIPGSHDEIIQMLYLFLDLAHKKLNLVHAEIISAVPLTQSQLEKVEKRLTAMFKKQLDITTTVDPSLLGGLRVIIDNTVIDDTIKRKLMDMKEKIYKGVSII